VSGRVSRVKRVGMAEMAAPISLDGVAVHPVCWCVCLCYFHFAPENPEDEKSTFCYHLTRVVLDKVQSAPNGCMCVFSSAATRVMR